MLEITKLNINKLLSGVLEYLTKFNRQTRDLIEIFYTQNFQMVLSQILII